MAIAAPAGAPVIGVAVSQGAIQVNQGTVQGNANLSAGSTVNSMSSEVRVKLNNGSLAALVPSSVAKFDGQAVELKSGGGVFTNTASYPVNAVGFDIRSAGSARAQLFIDKGQLQVGAVGGEVKVSGGGVLIARVAPGKAIALTPASTSERTSTLTGVLRQADGRWTLRDEATNIDAELSGGALTGNAGRRVEVTGKALPSNGRADQVIEVARLTPAPEQGGAARPTGQSGSSKPGSSAPQGKPSGSGGGMSSGAKVALIVAVGGGAAAGVLFATMSR